MGTYLFLRYDLFRRQAGAAFAPLKQFSAVLVLLAGHALMGLLAPLVLLGFQLFNPELALAERWPYLQMLLVMMLCWQGAVAWQQKARAEHYFVESLAPSAIVAWWSNKLMAMLNQLPVWLFTLPVLLYLLFSGKTLWWPDALQLLVVLVLLCWCFPASQTSWLALLAVCVMPQYSFWSVPLVVVMLLELWLQRQLQRTVFSAGSLFSYWFYWFIAQQQNKAMVLLLVFVLALWQYWLQQSLKAEALVFVNSVFIWMVALLCYAQQKLWQAHLKPHHYFWLSFCSVQQRLGLKLMNSLPVIVGCVVALLYFDATSLIWTLCLALAFSFYSGFGVLSVALSCFALLLYSHG